MSSSTGLGSDLNLHEHPVVGPSSVTRVLAEMFRALDKQARGGTVLYRGMHLSVPMERLARDGARAVIDSVLRASQEPLRYGDTGIGVHWTEALETAKDFAWQIGYDTYIVAQYPYEGRRGRYSLALPIVLVAKPAFGAIRTDDKVRDQYGMTDRGQTDPDYGTSVYEAEIPVAHGGEIALESILVAMPSREIIQSYLDMPEEKRPGYDLAVSKDSRSNWSWVEVRAPLRIKASARTYYHGTKAKLRPGDVLTFLDETGKPRPGGWQTGQQYEPGMMFAAGSPEAAIMYGERIYVVEPLGKVERADSPDHSYSGEQEYSCTSGWRVVSEVPRDDVIYIAQGMALGISRAQAIEIIDGARTAASRTTIWRGITFFGEELTPEQIIDRLRGRLGAHWSTERWVAGYWSRGGKGSTVVIEAVLPRGGRETDPAVLDALDVQGESGWEQEITLRPGTEIEVVRFSGSGWSRPGGRFVV